MLRNTLELMGCAIGATDGVVGEVQDVYFDDQAWTVRYLVVLTGAWLHRRHVLIPPASLGPPDWSRKRLPASISSDQVQSSPDIDTNKPVSRQHESLLLSHYRHPSYWEEVQPWASGPCSPVEPLASDFNWSQENFARAVAARSHEQAGETADAEQHLRSANAIGHYVVRCEDGDIGHLHGILFDEQDWAIRYVIVQTGHWWLGHEILIPVQWVHEVNWLDSCFSVDLTRETLKGAPVYSPGVALGRPQEIELFAYFGRAGYWEGAGMRRTP